MPVDTSIYGQIQPPQNPLATAGQAVQTMNGLAQNRLLQNENQLFQSRAQVGQLLSQAIDPKTGQFDRSKFNALVAGSNLGPAAMEALQGGNTAAVGQNEVGITGQQLSQERVKSVLSHQNLLSSILAPLTTPDANPTKDDVYKAASTLISNPDLDADSRKELLGQSLQFLGDLPDDPAQIKQRLKGLQLSVQDSGARLAAITGQAGLANNGSELVPTVTNNYTGTVSTGNGQPIPLKRSPEARGAMVSGPPGPNGEPTQAPSSAYVDDFGNPRQSSPAPAAPGTPAPAPSSPAHAVGLAPGTAEAGVANAQQAAAAHQIAQDAPLRRSTIQNLKDMSSQFDGGPLAGAALKARQALVEMHLLPPGAAASQEDFNKLALQIVQTQGQALGHTNMQTEISMSSNPNQGLSKEGRARVIALLQGNEDAIQARDDVWQNLVSSGKAKPEDWGKFTADFNRHFDPRAFQFHYMTPDQQKITTDGMAKDQRARFDQAVKFADWARGQIGQ